MNRKIILIPYWIEDNLRRKGLPLATVVDYSKLRAVTALDDMVALVALQNCWGDICGLREAAMGDMVLTWFAQLGPAGSPGNEELSNTVLPLSKDASVARELQTRLFSASSQLDHRKEAFITYDLTPEFAGAVISPGFFGAAAATRGVQLADKLSLQFVRAMLKALYVYEPQHEVAKAPLFKRYLSLLSV